MRQKFVWAALRLGGAMVAMLSTVGLITLVSAYEPLKSPEAAGWAQAIGSALAIGVAVYLSYTQHKNAVLLMQTADAVALRRKLDSICAIVRQAERETRWLKESILGDSHDYDSRIAKYSGEPQPYAALLIAALDAKLVPTQFSSVIETLQKIPMHELGSSSIVSEIYRLIASLCRVNETIIKANSNRGDYACVAEVGFQLNQVMDTAKHSRMKIEFEAQNVSGEYSSNPYTVSWGKYQITIRTDLTVPHGGVVHVHAEFEVRAAGHLLVAGGAPGFHTSTKQAADEAMKQAKYYARLQGEGPFPSK